MKYFYTDLINELVQDPAEKLKVLIRTVRIFPPERSGKIIPKAEEIRIDNYLRQEWNNMVDRAVVEGVSEEELRLTKKKEITDPAAESIRRSGWKPEIFRTNTAKGDWKATRLYPDTRSSVSGMQNMTRMDSQYFTVT